MSLTVMGASSVKSKSHNIRMDGRGSKAMSNVLLISGSVGTSDFHRLSIHWQHSMHELQVFSCIENHKEMLHG